MKLKQTAITFFTRDSLNKVKNQRHLPATKSRLQS